MSVTWRDRYEFHCINQLPFPLLRFEEFWFAIWWSIWWTMEQSEFDEWTIRNLFITVRLVLNWLLELPVRIFGVQNLAKQLIWKSLRSYRNIWENIEVGIRKWMTRITLEVCCWNSNQSWKYYILRASGQFANRSGRWALISIYLGLVTDSGTSW